MSWARRCAKHCTYKLRQRNQSSTATGVEQLVCEKMAGAFSRQNFASHAKNDPKKICILWSFVCPNNYANLPMGYISFFLFFNIKTTTLYPDGIRSHDSSHLGGRRRRYHYITQTTPPELAYISLRVFWQTLKTVLNPSMEVCRTACTLCAA
jgi:hypothetical protein